MKFSALFLQELYDRSLPAAADDDKNHYDQLSMSDEADKRDPEHHPQCKVQIKFVSSFTPFNDLNFSKF